MKLIKFEHVIKPYLVVDFTDINRSGVMYRKTGELVQIGDEVHFPKPWAQHICAQMNQGETPCFPEP